ncbi:hypothetical protein PV326_014081 [Microctonus aethiopoides]|nr:hypothetical protein PV326_014081 [Microctonus aethiopoides]
MLGYGADGETREELEAALNLPMNQKFIMRSFYDFIQYLNNATNVELHLANALFFNNNFKIKDIFRKVSTKIFNSMINNQLNFQNAAQSASIINDWCRQETRGKIREIIEADDLAQAKLVMINAIYFKGDWENRFNTHQKIDFHISNTNSVPIEMMCRYGKYNHKGILNGTARYIELPYKTGESNNKLSMYVILPVRNNRLDDIIDKIFKIEFVKLNREKSDIRLCMPKFKIESNLNLMPVLKKMGISSMFGNSANFSRMTDENVQISKIIQKTFISVDENGSEAAAATKGIIAHTLSMPTSIDVDKPFISVIVSKATGTPLFWARVNDPRSL